MADDLKLWQYAMQQAVSTGNYDARLAYTFPKPSTPPPLALKSGWLCPRCERVNAPHASHCECKA